MFSPHFEELLNYDYSNFYTAEEYAIYTSLQDQVGDYEAHFQLYNFSEGPYTPPSVYNTEFGSNFHENSTFIPKQEEKIERKPKMKAKVLNFSPYSDKENNDPYQQDDFVMCVKRHRIRLGFTQADVGISLGALYNKHFSQTTVCR